jgi:hypothetical protein
MVYGENVVSEGSIRQGVECSKMREQIFMMKSKVGGHL